MSGRVSDALGWEPGAYAEPKGRAAIVAAAERLGVVPVEVPNA